MLMSDVLLSQFHYETTISAKISGETLNLKGPMRFC